MRFPFLRSAVALAALALATSVRADPLVNNTGLTAPGTTITFSEVVLATDTPVTNQFASFGATFSPNLYYDPQAGLFPTPALGNYNNSSFPLINPASILFTQDVTAAAVAVQTGTGTTAFTALLDGVVVETFTAPTDSFGGNASNFYGFTNIVFNELRIQANPAFVIDNLQFNVSGAAAIPEPGTLALLLVGGLTTSAGFLRRRRA